MKRENGITLISLVITAMVMAILAGITISATIGFNGSIFLFFIGTFTGIFSGGFSVVR